jgi:peptidoglycan/xylan/chitin deacetylase (PgdA/CDA1 family)
VRSSARPSRRTLLGVAGSAAVGASLAGCSGASAKADGPPGTSAPSGSGATAPTSGSTPAASVSPAVSSRPAAGPDITHGSRALPAVALTFHGDGPESIVRELIATWRRHDAHVTVLAIGRWLAAAPDVVRMLRDAGHELGNHTWSHRTMPRLPAAQVRTEIDRADGELMKLTGSSGRWFRPSGTPTSTPAIRAAAVRAGYGACLSYDVDPVDYTDPGPDAIVRSFSHQVRPGSIVSLHLGHPGTVAAMPAILAHLHDRGLTAVTASELLTAGTRG